MMQGWVSQQSPIKMENRTFYLVVRQTLPRVVLPYRRPGLEPLRCRKWAAEESQESARVLENWGTWIEQCSRVKLATANIGDA
jgi:hypothetical protein